MNIFVLSPDPVEAAHFHCDQHLHKMILESAQMLSTALRYHANYQHLNPYLYKSTYENHPCNLWLRESFDRMDWVCTLATSLNSIREESGSNRHTSMDIIDAVSANLPIPANWTKVTDFAEAMYPHIKCRTDLTTVQKYQLYYQKKHAQWVLDKGRGMSYKGRLVPEFMQGVISGG